jgi:very-short-patch-repair endonuclease
MGTYYNRPVLNKRKRRLRNNMTVYERHLWDQIKSRKLCGVKFRRQYSVGSYILDFYSPLAKLGVEVDGEYHDSVEQQEYDRTRDLEIESNGIKLLRFKNEQVKNDLVHVLHEIASYLSPPP